jgi:hypothetical protein
VTTGTIYPEGATYEYYQPNEAEQRLIDALRSGEHRQGTGFLEYQVDTVNEGTVTLRCCLGVACRVSTQAFTIHECATVSRATRFSGKDQSLPLQVQEELRWADCYGKTSLRQEDENSISLVNLNDSGQFSFDQIADVIEAGLVLHA